MVVFMLHLRSDLSSRITPSLAPALMTPVWAVWDRMIASDPGLLRLVMAGRGTLSVLLMTITAVLIARMLGANPAELASGVVFSMMAPFLMREPTRRQRQCTLVLLMAPATLATIATTLLHGRGLLGDSFFLVLVFLCFLLQARSPRGIGLGLVAVVVSYVGLYLELPPATIGVQLLSIVAAVPVTAFACFVLLPVRPAATLRRTVQAIQGRAAIVLRDAGGLAATKPATATRLRRSLARLTEAALAADDQLALVAPSRGAELRQHLLELELAAARLVALPLDGQSSGLQQARMLRVNERRLRRGRWSAREQAGGSPSAMAASLGDITRAAAALGRAAQDLPAVPAASPALATPGPLAWRIAFRVTLASALAMGGGMLLSPNRWFWAVITTYVVFLNSRSRGDTAYKGVQRLGGTFLGLIAGLWLAMALQGNPAAQAAALLAAVFGMYYLFLISYTLGIFCVTVLLGLLYSLAGTSIEPLLLLRLEETAIGAGAAIAVEFLVLPTRTRDQVRRSGRAVLQNLATVVGHCRAILAGEPGASAMTAMRAVDRQVADLRLALLPLTAGRLMLRRAAAERPVPALLDCVHAARLLVAAATAPDAGAAARAETIERRLVALAQGNEPAEELAPAAGAGPAHEALADLDRATIVLAERLAIGHLQGFHVEA